MASELDPLAQAYQEAVEEPPIDPNLMTENELASMGFHMWDDQGLMLIPQDLFPKLKQGTLVTGIHGATKVVGVDDINTDTRFGLLGWGVYPKDA